MHLGQFLGFITGQHWRKPMIFATIEPILGLTYSHCTTDIETKYENVFQSSQQDVFSSAK